ncbi:MAG: hypothetical protein ACREEM_06520 [Blastocatellia bacterium]
MPVRNIRSLFLCAALLSLALMPTIAAQEVKPLTNQDVVRLVKLGLSSDIIVTKINESSASFDLSIEGLALLAQNRVPNDVIKAMQAKAIVESRPASSANSKAAPASVPGAASAGKTSVPLPPDKGVYLWDGKSMHLLHQSRVPSMGQSFWRSVTPFVKKKIELQMMDAHAKAHFDHNQPAIVVSGMGDVVPGVPSFRLLQVKTGGMRKDRRIVGTYDVGGFFGSVQMVDNEIECKMEKLADGIYAFRSAGALSDGEYGVVQVPKLAEVSSQPSFAPPIWDFGIYVEGRPQGKN